MKILFKDFIKISFLSVISIFLYPNIENKAEAFLFQGKCAFLMTSEYQEKCDALFKDNLLTLIPKGSIQKRVWPHQISQISLASYKTLVPDTDLSKWDKYIPDHQKTFFFIFKSKKKDSIPKWVLEATSKEEETHKFTIRYLDKKQKPQALLFILNDRKNAAGMISMLESYSGLSLGVPRKSTDKLDNNISKMIYKEAMRKANRLTGFCKEKMFEESKLIRSELNNFVNNTNEEISIFNHLENLSSDLAEIKLKANKYCDEKLNEQIAIKNLKIEKEKQKLEEELKIKKKLEEEERLKLEERKKAQEAFDMLSEF